MSKEYIAWVDVETTGLNPESNSLLEVACLITDKDLNLIDQVGFEAVVLYSPDSVEELKTECSPHVLEMHEKSGLWEELPYGLPLSLIDKELSNYIVSLTRGGRNVRLGGSSPRLDMNFTERFLPETFKTLTYRTIDVSTVQTLFDWWKVGDDTIPKKGSPEHRAMSDIRGSLAQLQKLKERILGVVG